MGCNLVRRIAVFLLLATLLVPGTARAHLFRAPPGSWCIEQAERWHQADRRHVLDLAVRAIDRDMLVEILYSEWLDVTRALVSEIEGGAVVVPGVGARVYNSDSTARILVLSLAKSAREAFLTSVLDGTGQAYSSGAYPSLFDRGSDGAWLSTSAIRRSHTAVTACAEQCSSLLGSLELPEGALAGVAYFLSPYVSGRHLAQSFSHLNPGPDEYAVISAVEPGDLLRGWPDYTLFHETGHLVHFEYMGDAIEANERWQEYLKLRNAPLVTTGRWEALTEENFAEDFRLGFSESVVRHRGSYGEPDEPTRAAIRDLVNSMISRGPAGTVKFSDLVFFGRDAVLSAFSVPGGTPTFVTAEPKITLSGNASALTPGVVPVLTFSRPASDNTYVHLGTGDFALTLEFGAQGVYFLTKGYTDMHTMVNTQLVPSLVVMRVMLQPNRLADVGAHWSRYDLGLMLLIGVLQGYPDGSVKPETPISRAEFVKMLSLVMGISPSDCVTPFVDVEAHWAAGYIAAAHQAGWIRAAAYGSRFEPDRLLDRQEMAAIVASVLGMSHEEQTALALLAHSGLIEGFPDGTYEPARLASRGEAATVLSRLRRRLLQI